MYAYIQLQERSCALGCVPVLDGNTQTQLKDLSTELPTNLSLDDIVCVYGAVMSANQQLVHTGDYIQIVSDSSEVCTCMLLHNYHCHFIAVFSILLDQFICSAFGLHQQGNPAALLREDV